MKKTRDFSPRMNLLQFRVLLVRYLRQIVTNPWFIVPLVLQPVVLLIITSLVYEDGTFSEPWAHITSANSTPFLLVLSSALMGLLNSYREICKEREVTRREVFGGVDVISYLASKVAALGIVGFVQSLVISLGSLSFIDYNLSDPAYSLFFIVMAVFLTNWCVTGLGLLVSALLKKSESAIRHHHNAGGVRRRADRIRRNAYGDPLLLHARHVRHVCDRQRHGDRIHARHIRLQPVFLPRHADNFRGGIPRADRAQTQVRLPHEGLIPPAADKGENMLKLENICYDVDADRPDRAKRILSDVSLEFPDRSLTVITGHNGSGKSTLVKLIMGIDKPTSGRILFNGADVTGDSVTDRALKGFTIAFQQPVRFKGITVRNLLDAACRRKCSTGDACNFLYSVGLCAKDYIDRPVDDTLSGGELKRIELATALAKGGEVFLLDEPEAGIDLWSFDELVGVFDKLRDKTVIIVSHQSKILQAADRIVVLNSAAQPVSGPRDEILPGLTDVGAPYCRRGYAAKE